MFGKPLGGSAVPDSGLLSDVSGESVQSGSNRSFLRCLPETPAQASLCRASASRCVKPRAWVSAFAVERGSSPGPRVAGLGLRFS